MALMAQNTRKPQKIVAEIESERELVEANKRLFEIFEKKIKGKIGEVWGE